LAPLGTPDDFRVVYKHFATHSLHPGRQCLVSYDFIRWKLD